MENSNPFHMFRLLPGEHQSHIKSLLNNLLHTDPSKQESGGWQHTFVSDVVIDYECMICKLPLRDPWQLKCGHRLCASCSLVWFSKCDHPKCPKCGDYGIVRIEEVFPDNHARRCIFEYSVHCLLYNKGCEWIGFLRDHDKHEQMCLELEIDCPFGCNIGKMPRKRMLAHQKTCDNRIVPCIHCNQEIIIKDMPSHLGYHCPHAPVPCDHCKQQCTRSKLENHLKVDCPEYELACPFANSGCTTRVRRAELNSHVQKSTDQHMQLISVRVDALLVENKTLQDRVTAVTETAAVAAGAIHESSSGNQHENECNISRRFENIRFKIDQATERMETKFAIYDRDEKNIDWKFTRYDRKLLEHEGRVCNGSFIWRIENYRQCRQDAVNGIMTAIRKHWWQNLTC